MFDDKSTAVNTKDVSLLKPISSLVPPFHMHLIHLIPTSWLRCLKTKYKHKCVILSLSLSPFGVFACEAQ